MDKWKIVAVAAAALFVVSVIGALYSVLQFESSTVQSLTSLRNSHLDFRDCHPAGATISSDDFATHWIIIAWNGLGYIPLVCPKAN